MEGWGRCQRCGSPARGEFCSEHCAEAENSRNANLPDRGSPEHGHTMTMVFNENPTDRNDWWWWVCANPGCDLETPNPLELEDLTPTCEGERIYDG